jgi:hypothetical protein
MGGRSHEKRAQVEPQLARQYGLEGLVQPLRSPLGALS